MRAELDRIETTCPTDKYQWTKLSVAMLEAIMQCQSIVVEAQRQMLGDTRRRETMPLPELRQRARELLRIVDELTDLYRYVQTKIPKTR